MSHSQADCGPRKRKAAEQHVVPGVGFFAEIAIDAFSAMRSPVSS